MYAEKRIIMKKKGKALITGSTSGIGLALTKKLVQEGYDLILVASDPERLEQEKKAIRKWMPDCQVSVYAKDLSQSGAAEELYTAVKQDGHRIHFLVNNAGFGMVGPAEKMDFTREREMLQLLMITPAELCKLCLREMYETGDGVILNVSSTGAFQPGPYTASYYAAKSFLYQYSRGIRYEANRHGVKVCTLCPGTTRTSFFRKEGKNTPVWAMSPAKVAEAAWDGITKNREVIVPGKINQIMRFIPVGIRVRGIALLKK